MTERQTYIKIARYEVFLMETFFEKNPDQNRQVLIKVGWVGRHEQDKVRLNYDQLRKEGEKTYASGTITHFGHLEGEKAVLQEEMEMEHPIYGKVIVKLTKTNAPPDARFGWDGMGNINILHG